MIEHGRGTVPVLFDYNEDGLNDLMVANFYRYKPLGDKESVVAYYRNIGTNNDPIFQLVDDDILNLQAENFGLRSVPTFGDIDGDGDEDMFIGFEDGTLAYYQNYSSGGGADFILEVLSYSDMFGNIINTSGYCHPQLFDINEDGLLDLLLGTKSGDIQFYENVGTVNNPLFELANPNLGSVSVNTTSPDGYAAPHFFHHNGNINLFIGSVDGNIGYYDSIENNLSVGDTFNLNTSNFLDIQVGSYSACWTDDIDNDSALNMFLGQDLGGLFHYEVDTSSNVGLMEILDHTSLNIYPNPASNQVTIELVDAIGEKVAITDMNGRVVIERQLKDMITLSLDNLENGVYFVQVITQDKKKVVKKLIKR